MKPVADKPAAISMAMNVWLWIVTIFLLFRMVLYLLYAAEHILYPYDYDAGEGLILSRAWILAQGGNVYSSIHQEPYFVMNYPPVFEALVAGIIKLCGPGLWIGRLLSVTAAGVTGYCLYRTVRHLSGKTLCAAVAGLLYFSSCWLTSWSVIGRIDTFGVMCAVAGLAVITRPPGAMARRGPVLAAAVLFSLALFTRQSLIAAPLACVLSPIWARKQKDTDQTPRLTFLAAMIAIPAVVAATLMMVTHGEFWRHTVIYTMGEYDLAEFWRWMSEFLNLHGVIVLLNVFCAVIFWRSGRFRLPVLFWALSLLVALTAGKEGSSINYFLEFWAANCLLAGLMLGELAGEGRWRKIAGPVVVGILLVQILVMHYRTDFNPVRATYREASQVLANHVRQAPGEVLSEYTGYLVMNGKEPVYQPFSMTQLAEREIWDEDPLINDIKRQRFSLIIMTNVGRAYGRWSRRMQEAVDTSYELIDTQPCYELSYYHSAVNINFVYRRKTPGEGQ